METPASLWIDGAPRDRASGGLIELIEPSTGRAWAKVPAAGKSEINEALELARKAFHSSAWSNANPADRTAMLTRLARLIRDRAEELALLESRNVGKPIGDARWEINAGARCFDYYAAAIRQYGGETIPVANDGLDFTLRVPVGVVAAIVPWNFPFLIACWKVAPALASGCSVVLKPASLTPITALALGRLASEAGVPSGVFQVLAGRGSDVGDDLVTHPLVRKIAFTGDTSTGARILRLASGEIKRVSLELGGKSPNIIFADADIETAASSSPLAVFGNTGQDCCARSRILVQKPVYDRFVEAFVNATKNLVVGDPAEEKTQLGPMVSAGQRERVEEYLGIARQEGGRVLVGGERLDRPGFYLSPAVIDGLPPTSRVCREEIFGPVASILPFDSEEEALAIANDTPYGLSGSLWTKDVERALRLARRLECGVLSINTNSSVFQEAPFGGFKQSGFGRDLGLRALDLYTELKNVFIKVPGF